MEHFSSFSVRFSIGQLVCQLVPYYFFSGFLAFQRLENMNQSVLHVLEHFQVVFMFFYKPISWLVGLYVNLSPVNIFTFLSSLKFKICLIKISCKYANVQVCKCASMQMFKYANRQVCKCASMLNCKYANMQVCK